MFQIFLTTFLAVFIAEMGDKTQLATFGFATENDKKLPVFLGAALALICTSAIGVLAGALVGKYIPAHYIRMTAGILFIAIGLYTLVKGNV